MSRMNAQEIIRFLAARCIAHGDDRNVDFILAAYREADRLDEIAAPSPPAETAFKVSDLLLIVRENERMKTALQSILSHAGSAVMGGWRQKVFNMASIGLGQKQ